MAERIIKLPDVGEGVAEAEIVELHVKPGDPVREGDVLAAVMTDKATVEIPSPAEGRVLRIAFEVGQKAAVGSELMSIEIGEAAAKPVQRGQGREAVPPRDVEEMAAAAAVAAERLHEKPAGKASLKAPEPRPAVRALDTLTMIKPADRPLAAPAVRAFAREHGVDLRFVKGSGPAGRIQREDVEAYIARADQAASPASGLVANTAVEEIKIIGLRRKIAQRMQDTKRRIPHFSYIEEVDVTDLEALRSDVNATKKSGRPRLTVLPFLMRALAMALRQYPQMNARFDDETDTLYRHGGAHIGIAVQTPSGLMVTVVRHAEARTIWECAGEVQRLSEAARSGGATREELTGSTITITSLGALGGIASTPIINAPEVAIVGVNKIAMRPVWRGSAFEPRKIMNLSSSFDHRIIDGWEAAEFIQHLRSLLETPAKIFMET
ncbi:MAG: 2-oxo acid dehydrogenase subunit E2 [Sphingomonadales bacterium]|nr:2-oxo acid dehydrogenase subunit E2 [Sphingomonadales bacterium]